MKVIPDGSLEIFIRVTAAPPIWGNASDVKKVWKHTVDPVRLSELYVQKRIIFPGVGDCFEKEEYIVYESAVSDRFGSFKVV